MAVYRGNYLDAGLKPLAAFAPTIAFTLENDESDAPKTVVGNNLVSQRAVVVTPQASGGFEVELIPNDEISGDSWYRVTARYLDAASNFIEIDMYRLFARASGGWIGDMIGNTGFFRPAYVIAQPTQPDPFPIGWIWWNTDTDDLNRRVG